MRPARSKGNRQRWPRHGRKIRGGITHSACARLHLLTSDRCKSDCPGGTRLFPRILCGYRDLWVNTCIDIFSEASPNKASSYYPWLCVRQRSRDSFLRGWQQGLAVAQRRAKDACCYLVLRHMCVCVLHLPHCGQPCTLCKPRSWCAVVGRADSSAPTVAPVCLLVRDLTPGYRRAVQVLGSIHR